MRIGIIGAGQLGRMLALAGYPLGLRFVFLDKSPEAPGAQVGNIITGEFSDPKRIAELAANVDILTYDVENVPADAIREVAEHTPFLPPPKALEIGQDRLSEKALFNELGIETPAYRAVDSFEDLSEAVANLGLPAVLKTRRLGYDGRGQRVIRRADDIPAAWEALGGVPLILEAFIAFEREVSIIGVRSTQGGSRFYALAENTHVDGILHHTVAPYDNRTLQVQAEAHCGRLMDVLDYAGILTIEFFVEDGRLIANEIAPRVHNSGHWTIEGATTSQFENHIRAILGLPLGDTQTRGYSAMVNFIGELPPLETVLAIPGAHYHDYGKTPRPLRKLGHCTISSMTRAQRDASLAQLLAVRAGQ